MPGQYNTKYSAQYMHIHQWAKTLWPPA